MLLPLVPPPDVASCPYLLRLFANVGNLSGEHSAMASSSCGNNFAFRGTKLAAPALGLAFACQVSISRAEDKKSSACNEDAMLVFDASGSMSGNQTLGIP